MRTLHIKRETLEELGRLKKQLREKYARPEGEDYKFDVDRHMQWIMDPLQTELNAILKSFDTEQRREMSALMWMGRGDFESYDDAYNYAKDFDNQPEQFVVYVKEKPLFEYIPAGIEALENEGFKI